MANEITVNSTLSYSKNGVKASITGSYSITQVGDHVVTNVQDVGTVEETLVKGDIGTVGMVFFRNMDDTNFVQLGAATGAYSIKIPAGKSTGAIPWNGSNVYAKADTAGIKLDYLLIEA